MVVIEGASGTGGDSAAPIKGSIRKAEVEACET